MAETLVSPGVLARENDQSFIQQQPVQVGAAIVGPAVKGPVEIPTVVTSYSDYQNRFGTTFESGSDVYSYFTSIAAYNYFQNGGNTLLVTRVVSASATWDNAIASVSSSEASGSFELEILNKGELYNNSGSTLSNGALSLGTADNIRWEVTTANTASGTFSLAIRRGNDDTNNKVVLESYDNLSLDPKQSNYIGKVIGDQTLNYNSTENYMEVSGSYPNASRYVRVKNVANTPDYFDNNGTAKAEYVGFIPAIGSGSLSGAFKSGGGSNVPASEGNYYENISTQSQGLVAADYTDMLNLLANQDDYAYNVLLTPGLTDESHSSPMTTALNNVQSRGDALYVMDLVDYGSTIAEVKSEASGRDSSYGAAYWPWVSTQDPDSGKNVWVPASTLIGGVYAFNDSSSEPWFAPAGINRGGLTTVIRPERKLSQANRDELYEANINPIASFPATGVVVYGQKTLQKRASALDRVNVRRLLIELKGYIGQLSQTLVFEQNTAATRNTFLSQVNPYLESVVQRQGLYAFKVVMDDSNNTPDVIDRNQLVGQIFIQPTRTAEFIILDFNVLPTGATFPA